MMSKNTHVKNDDVIQFFSKLLSNDFNIIELLENDERERQMLEVKSEHEMI